MPSPDPPSAPPSTAQLIAWDREFLWHPFTPMKPWIEGKDIVVIERGEREFVIDTLGRRYIDGTSSLWCNVHGHCVPELDAALRAQLAKIAHTTLLGLTNVPAILLARRLVQLARTRGLALDRVFYSDDGSTAVEVACKMAYQYWHNLNTPRQKFIAFENAYHGDTLGAVSVGGIPAFHAAFRGLCFPVDLIRWHPNHGLPPLLAALESRLQEGGYAAVIIEPLIQGAGGMRLFPPGTLAAVRHACTRHHTLLIADEVLTGFGRTGKMFACEPEAIAAEDSARDRLESPREHTRDGENGEDGGNRDPASGGSLGGTSRSLEVDSGYLEGLSGSSPDLLCLSKGLTAGYLPLGVTMATSPVFQAFYVDPDAPGNAAKTFFHGHTFTGHPLACAVALESLNLFEKNDLLRHVSHLIPLLQKTLSQARSMPYVADTRQCGLIGALDLAQPAASGGGGEAGGAGAWQPFPPHWRVASELCTRLRTLGLMLRPLADTLVIMPPLAIQTENMERLCTSLLQGLSWLPEIVADKQVT